MVRPRLYFAFHFPSSALLVFVRRIPLPQSARGLAQSMTLRAVRKSLTNASRFGVRRPSAAFHPPQGLAGVPVRVKESCRAGKTESKTSRVSQKGAMENLQPVLILSCWFISQ
jgi:hypothetical protein